MVRRCRNVALLLLVPVLTAGAPRSTGASASKNNGGVVRIVVGNSALGDAVRGAFAARDEVGPGAPVVDVSTHPLATLQDAVASGATPPDVLLMPITDVELGCTENLLRPLLSPTRCAEPVLAAGIVVAADPARARPTPRWADFWDVARLPGRRGLPRDGRGTLEIALIADGVPPGEVYATLGTEAGAARAFRKLEQLRPYVDWWTDGVAARRALVTGSVRITALPLSVIPVGSPSATLDFDPGGALADDLCWAVPRSAAHADAAVAFVTGPADATVAAAIGARLAVRPLAALSGEASRSPLSGNRPAVRSPMLTIDPKFWRDHQSLAARFRAWLAS